MTKLEELKACVEAIEIFPASPSFLRFGMELKTQSLGIVDILSKCVILDFSERERSDRAHNIAMILLKEFPNDTDRRYKIAYSILDELKKEGDLNGRKD